MLLRKGRFCLAERIGYNMLPSRHQEAKTIDNPKETRSEMGASRSRDIIRTRIMNWRLKDYCLIRYRGKGVSLGRSHCNDSPVRV